MKNIFYAACIVAAVYVTSAKADETDNIECAFDISDKSINPGLNAYIRFEINFLSKFTGEEMDTYSPEKWTPVHIYTTLYDIVVWDENGVDNDRGPFKLTINRHSKVATLEVQTVTKGSKRFENGICTAKPRL